MRKNVLNILSFAFLIGLIVFPLESSAKSKKDFKNPTLAKSAGYSVEDVLKVHNIGKLWSATSNYGVYGDP